jgi:predicted enzyme related to lactoylglutathione lyase
MIGSENPKILGKFYEKLIGRSADWSEGDWSGWQVGNMHLTIGFHSEVHGPAKEPERLILNFETTEVAKEFKRIKALGGKVIKEPYEMEGVEVATFADPDGNFFQLMTPWEAELPEGELVGAGASKQDVWADNADAWALEV